jgi:hypothetical protein
MNRDVQPALGLEYTGRHARNRSFALPRPFSLNFHNQRVPRSFCPCEDDLPAGRLVSDPGKVSVANMPIIVYDGCTSVNIFWRSLVRNSGRSMERRCSQPRLFRRPAPLWLPRPRTRRGLTGRQTALGGADNNPWSVPRRRRRIEGGILGWMVPPSRGYFHVNRPRELQEEIATLLVGRGITSLLPQCVHSGSFVSSFAWKGLPHLLHSSFVRSIAILFPPSAPAVRRALL